MKFFKNIDIIIWIYAWLTILHIGGLFLASLSFDEPLALYINPLIILGYAFFREYEIKKNYIKIPQPIKTNVNIKV